MRNTRNPTDARGSRWVKRLVLPLIAAAVVAATMLWPDMGGSRNDALPSVVDIADPTGVPNDADETPVGSTDALDFGAGGAVEAGPAAAAGATSAKTSKSVATVQPSIPTARPSSSAAAASDLPGPGRIEDSLIVGDKLAFRCVMNYMEPAAFTGLMRTIGQESTGSDGPAQLARAMTEAYREAFVRIGSSSEVIALVCGARVCAIELVLRHPADRSAELDAELEALLGAGRGVSATFPPDATGARAFRAVVPATNEIDAIDQTRRECLD